MASMGGAGDASGYSTYPIQPPAQSTVVYATTGQPTSTPVQQSYYKPDDSPKKSYPVQPGFDQIRAAMQQQQSHNPMQYGFIGAQQGGGLNDLHTGYMMQQMLNNNDCAAMSSLLQQMPHLAIKLMPQVCQSSVYKLDNFIVTFFVF